MVFNPLDSQIGSLYAYACRIEYSQMQIPHINASDNIGIEWG